MEDRRSVHYEKRHEEIVESGIDALSMALHNENEEEKASILFCLDNNSDYLKKARKYGHFTGYRN